MREEARQTYHQIAALRITPAYAGRRELLTTKLNKIKDHPRVCGKKQRRREDDRMTWGSPPRMREEAFFFQPLCKLPGITPAYAGRSNCCGEG